MNTSDYRLVDFRRQPSHAPVWPGKYIAVFKCPPMTYILVYNEDRSPCEWPKSIDEATAEALRVLFPPEENPEP